MLEGQNDPTVFIRGANTFDIAGDAAKDYKLNFLALRAGLYKFTTTFKVKETGEYMFYNFQVNVAESTDVEKIALESSVRETVSYGVVIENPTKDDVKLTKSMFAFTNEYVEITPDEVNVQFMIVKRRPFISEDFPTHWVQEIIPAQGKIKLKKAVQEFESFIRDCFTTDAKYIDREYPKNFDGCKWCEFKDKPELCSKS